MQNMDEIYKNYSSIVYKYLVYLTHDMNIAEEITQETFYVAVRDIGKFRGECKIETWLCQIAKYLWYKEQKVRKKIKNVNIEECFEIESDEATNIVSKEEKSALYRALEKLNDVTKQVILLRVSAELSFRQIGDIYHKSEIWARVTFYRGKEKLKEVLRLKNRIGKSP